MEKQQPGKNLTFNSGYFCHGSDSTSGHSLGVLLKSNQSFLQTGLTRCSVLRGFPRNGAMENLKREDLSLKKGCD